MLKYFWINRERPPVLSRKWFKCWIKRIFLAPRFLNQEWHRVLYCFVEKSCSDVEDGTNRSRRLRDKDFFISMAMAGAKIVYQPGCHSIYRRYGPVTISTSNRRRWLDNHQIVLDKALGRLEKEGRLTSKYCRAAAHSYFALARNYFDLDRDKYEFLMHKVLELDPKFRPSESLVYNMTQRLLGYSAGERLASFKRRQFPSNPLGSRS